MNKNMIWIDHCEAVSAVSDLLENLALLNDNHGPDFEDPTQEQIEAASFAAMRVSARALRPIARVLLDQFKKELEQAGGAPLEQVRKRAPLVFTPEPAGAARAINFHSPSLDYVDEGD